MPNELRPWTKEDVRLLKSLAREKTKPIVIARKLIRQGNRTRRVSGHFSDKE